MLWRFHAELARLAHEAWPDALSGHGAAAGCHSRWHTPLDDAPEAGAVRVAHALAMGPPGLSAWTASWPGRRDGSPALRCALAAAPLLAGHHDLFLLVAPAAAGMEPHGALVDGDTCASLALAGHDPSVELQLGNHARPLADCGALARLDHVLAAAASGTRYLLLGMRTGAIAGH